MENAKKNRTKEWREKKEKESKLKRKNGTIKIKKNLKGKAREQMKRLSSNTWLG